jgi:hypothetical protein
MAYGYQGGAFFVLKIKVASIGFLTNLKAG